MITTVYLLGQWQDTTNLRENHRDHLFKHTHGVTLKIKANLTCIKNCTVRYKISWLVLLHHANMLQHHLDVKKHIVHYTKSAFNVYFHINLACNMEVSLHYTQ